MENFVALLIPGVLAYVLVKSLMYPMLWIWKAAVHCLCGFLCLWLLNTVSGFTGVYLPVNAATVWIAGIFGVPGISVITLLAMI